MKLDVLSLLPSGRAVDLQSELQSGLQVDVLDVLKGFAPTIDVPDGGVSFPFAWGPTPPGTDRVELDPIQVDVVADEAANFAGYSLGELATAASGTDVIVTVPGDRTLRALHIASLKADDLELASEQALVAAGRRLTVSLPDPRGGWAAPIVAVPSVDPRGQIPRAMTGATYANRVLTLPDLPGGRIKLSVVEGDTPDKFNSHPASTGKVIGFAAPTPMDLTLAGPDGEVLLQLPGRLPANTSQQFDVTVPVAAAVEALRKAGKPINGALKLTSASPCKVGFRVSAVRGVLVRTLPGTTKVNLQGEPVTLPLDEPLPAAIPGTVVADVAVVYEGRRLADISDALPQSGAVNGVVVRATEVVRTLPPQALEGSEVASVGLVGWCTEPTALLVRIASSDTGETLGEPGSVRVDPSVDSSVVWVDLPAPVSVDRPVCIAVSAGTGAFNWVGEEQPLVRLVVLDPDPGGRPVVVGGRTLVTVGKPEQSAQRATLPASEFAGSPPEFASALFCRIEVTDAELRYPRGG